MKSTCDRLSYIFNFTTPDITKVEKKYTEFKIAQIQFKESNGGNMKNVNPN